MRIIDMHTHAFPDHIAESALTVVGGNAGVTPCYDGTVDGLRTALRHAGVELGVVQPVASKPSQVRPVNQWAAGVRDGDVLSFAAMHPDVDDLEAEMEHVAGQGFLGVKLHPEYQSFWPDEARLDPLYETAIRHRLIVYFHAGEDLGLPSVHSTPEVFARVLDRHPEVKLVLAHMGGWRQWDDVKRHLVGKDVCLDTSFTLPYLGADGLVDLITAHGAERVVFGSDMPWGELSAEVAQIAALPLSPQDRESVLWRTAARLLQHAGSFTRAHA